MALLYFILGILFIEFVFPILDSLATLIATYIEHSKGQLSYDIAKYNVSIAKLNKDDEEYHTNPIGFVISSDENIEEEDDEDE